MSVRVFMVLLLCCPSGWVDAQTGNWFTIVGAPEDPSLNTVQVDPSSIERDDEQRTMRIRVSRSTLRTSWDGVNYRSYNASVQIDCRDHSARYLSISFYAQPVWRGTVFRTVDYSKGTVRAMGFKDVVPNPHQRIVFAACAAGQPAR